MNSRNAPSLRDLQEVLTAVVSGRATQDEKDLAHSWVDPSGKQISSEERLEIYSDGWFLRLEESLRDDFPSVRRSLSETVWEQIVKDYLKCFPSKTFTLSRVGDCFPGFLSEQTGLPKWLPDVALLEKALYKALGARDIEIWDVSELQNYDAEQAGTLLFQLQPPVSILRSTWRILDALGLAQQAPMVQETYVVVYRDGFSPVYRELAVNEGHFLIAMSQGASLGELVDQFQESNWLAWLSLAASEGIIHPVLK